MNNELQRVQDLQMMPIEETKKWYNDFLDFSKSILKANIDYGAFGGVSKPSLLKAGAEKLRFVYGLSTEMEVISAVTDMKTLFIDYSYRCTVKNRAGMVLSQCEGNANSHEPNFRYTWKPAEELPESTDLSKLQKKTTGRRLLEMEFAINKAETAGKYGKPKEYWQKWKDAIADGRAKKVDHKTKDGKTYIAYEMGEQLSLYRAENPDVIGMKNTIMKIAQKRAFVGAILLATGASEFYTQDLEDMQGFDTPEPVIPEVHSAPPETPPAKPADNSTPKPTDIYLPHEEVKDEPVAGHWFAKMEKCKFKEDVILIYNSHKLTVDAHPNLQKVFRDTMDSLKSNK